MDGDPVFATLAECAGDGGVIALRLARAAAVRGAARATVGQHVSFVLMAIGVPDERALRRPSMSSNDDGRRGPVVQRGAGDSVTVFLDSGDGIRNEVAVACARAYVGDDALDGTPRVEPARPGVGRRIVLRPRSTEERPPAWVPTPAAVAFAIHARTVAAARHEAREFLVNALAARRAAGEGAGRDDVARAFCSVASARGDWVASGGGDGAVTASPRAAETFEGLGGRGFWLRLCDAAGVERFTPPVVGEAAGPRKRARAP